jgi:glycine/serine hydroxymethyltransferase
MMDDGQINLIKFLEGYGGTKQNTLSMHASESSMSEATRAALSHNLSSRYSSNDPGNKLIPANVGVTCG